MDTFHSTILPEFGPDDDVQVEVIEPDQATTERSLSRRLALQVLYEVDSAQHNPEVVMKLHLAAQPVSSKIASYLRRLVRGVSREPKKIDHIIQEYAPEWPLNQVAIVDRNILRLAVYEFVFEPRIPVGVVIDEAVALANLFGAEGSLRFVNGVLGALAEDIDSLRARLAPPEDETT